MENLRLKEAQRKLEISAAKYIGNPSIQLEKKLKQQQENSGKTVGRPILCH